MGVPPVNLAPMTVEDFAAFADKRPDEEKWELIDGEPILNAWSSRLHQQIVLNVATTIGSASMLWSRALRGRCCRDWGCAFQMWTCQSLTFLLGRETRPEVI